MSIRFSIIVPIYNVRQYLLECLNSVSAQSHTEFECICVDDGSNDGSGKVADEYAAKDHRFSVIHQDNGGLSAARNTGIANAKYDWLIFVDADDYIHPDMCSRMAAAIEKEPRTILHFVRMLLVDRNGCEEPPERQVTTCDIECVSTDVVHGCLAKSSSAWFLMSAWAKCFRRDVIMGNVLLFDWRLSPGEDSVFVLKYLAFADGVYTVDMGFVGYFYRQHESSITHNVMQVKRRLCDYYILDESLEFARQHPKTKPLFVRGLLGVISRLSRCPKELRSEYIHTVVYAPIFKRTYLMSILMMGSLPYKLMAAILLILPRLVTCRLIELKFL